MRRRHHEGGTIPAGEFKARCLELMNEVRERRTEYVVTKRGKAVAKLRKGKPSRRTGTTIQFWPDGLVENGKKPEGIFEDVTFKR